MRPYVAPFLCFPLPLGLLGEGQGEGCSVVTAPFRMNDTIAARDVTVFNLDGVRRFYEAGRFLCRARNRRGFRYGARGLFPR